jgi:hypothetical protein
VATKQLNGILLRADHRASKLDALDAATRAAASHRRSTPPAPKPARRILESFPASAPRGSWPAEEFAADRRRDGIPARVVMDLATDRYLVIVEEVAA